MSAPEKCDLVLKSCLYKINLKGEKMTLDRKPPFCVFFFYLKTAGLQGCLQKLILNHWKTVDFAHGKHKLSTNCI